MGCVIVELNLELICLIRPKYLNLALTYYLSHPPDTLLLVLFLVTFLEIISYIHTTSPQLQCALLTIVLFLVTLLNIALTY